MMKRVTTEIAKHRNTNYLHCCVPQYQCRFCLSIQAIERTGTDSCTTHRKQAMGLDPEPKHLRERQGNIDVGQHFCPAPVLRLVVLEDVQICHCLPSCIDFILSDPVNRRPAYWAHGQPNSQTQWPNPVLPLSAIASRVAAKLQMECKKRRRKRDIHGNTY